MEEEESVDHLLTSVYDLTIKIKERPGGHSIILQRCLLSLEVGCIISFNGCGGSGI